VLVWCASNLATNPRASLTLQQFRTICRALSDPRRVALLESIGSEPEYSCQDLCKEAGVSKGTVSHHMDVLVKAGLIVERRRGQYMFYEVRRDVIAAYAAELIRRVAPHAPT
jgi:ArsR family transcriptional regulator, arsenate/arsenite/antimonite-responsive transcriptional repressor